MTYQHRFGRGLLLGLFAAFGIAGVLLVAATAAGGPDAPSPLFAAFWLGIMGWNAYWWLLHIPFRLTVDAEALAWQTALRVGQIPLPDITRIRPMRWSSSVVVVEHTGGRPLVVVATKGLRHVVAELSNLRPDLEIRLGWQARLAERLPGSDAWRENDPR